MPCTYDSVRNENLSKQRQEEERKRKKKEREDAFRRIEEALGAGLAHIVKNSDGTISLVGAELPEDMYDSCVLAALSQRNSMEFQSATSNASVGNYDFVGVHDALHRS